ncbi:hypothetical protein [Methylophilus sp. Leaf414]|uniref:capsular polysaccharide export protein, LipB/KpsS family n=1 Tax=Methylophilus sp. Leaf414 TaxID=1736371 RepID=UPI0006F8A0D6|nr:hypothetical protein [Methylophilus sp. Leaf414]KQT34470.1 hypothetical protein ASG24_12220 [Methylophilus sp. Leaf414]
MTTKALYYVFSDIFVPFFLNLSEIHRKLYHYEPYLVSFTPRERRILQKNGYAVYPADLSEIDAQENTSALNLSESDIDDLFAFMHAKHKGSKTEWIRRTSTLLGFLESFIQKNQINLIVVWNGQDHVARALTEIAKKHHIRTVYMENGYFSNTLQADTQGVNMSASNRTFAFSKINELSQLPAAQVPSELIAPTLVQVNQLSSLNNVFNFLKRILDFKFYAKFPELRGSSWFMKRKLDKARLAIPLDTILLPNNYAFLPLQVHDDTQILINSPHFKDPKQFIRHCYQQIREALGAEYPIIVKEHPEDFLRYDYDDIRAEFPDIIWLRKFDIEKLLDNATFVAVINSSVGLQAIAREKPVIVYGDSIYSRDQICSFITDLSQSKNVILDASKPISEERRQNIKTYLKYINSHFFFKGSWKNFSPESISECAYRIHKLVN